MAVSRTKLSGVVRVLGFLCLGTGLLIVTQACDKKGAEWTLERAGQRMFEVRGVPLGDIVSIDFGPFGQADWFVVYPAMADAASFSTITRLTGNEAALKEISGRPSPGMALIEDDAVLEDWPFPEPYATRKVHARPGDAVYGIRFARYAGSGRNFIVLGID